MNRSKSLKSLDDELREALGERYVITDPDIKRTNEIDWTGRFVGSASMVVSPANTQEVALTMRAAATHDVAVVAQGGNTGLVGGGVPRHGELVLSTRRLTTLEPVDMDAAQTTVGAGVTLAALHRHVRSVGLDMPVDLTPRDSATIGGIVATNAGGEKVLRYGTTRASVAGLEVVLADGTIVSRMSGLTKDNAGYDLPSLFVGSEGTLGIITQARLRLVPLYKCRTVALLAVDSTASALQVLGLLKADLRTLEAAEVFYLDGLELVCAHNEKVSSPFAQKHPAYLLIECADRTDPTDELAEALSTTTNVLDVAVAADQPGRAALWALREEHSGSINQRGIPLKLDVTVPTRVLASFETDLRELVARTRPHAELYLFGHLNEGNFHVNLLGVDPEDEELTSTILDLVVAYAGSVCSEHGVGIAKAPWLSRTRSADDINAMRAIKTALDPRGLLNPGVVLTVATSK
ncbi:FAD-binding oxidoreductase [Parafrigoribacterium mesophilum]|uniref:FAD-binding oxidoreductase n=1 Tax=Parafrigoribacterium mesophilum TaxID=433646 RepID=UPI0031FC3A66